MPARSTDTRRRILETAYELFYRKGYARVGVDLIAEQAGLTKRTLYYHFESKDALPAAVLAFHHELALLLIQGHRDYAASAAAAAKPGRSGRRAPRPAQGRPRSRTRPALSRRRNAGLPPLP